MLVISEQNGRPCNCKQLSPEAGKFCQLEYVFPALFYHSDKERWALKQPWRHFAAEEFVFLSYDRIFFKKLADQ